MYGNLSICIILSVLSSILFRVGYAYCIPAAASISRLRIPSQATRNRMSKFAVAKSTTSHFTHAPLSQKILLENGISTSESPKELSFVVYGEPMPLRRHRVLRSGITYNPSSKLQNEFLQACTGALPGKPMEGPLEVRVVFYFKRPLNHFGTGKNKSVLKKGMDFWHSKRKDVDNLAKFVLDAINKKAYLDDGQVSVLSTAKLYADTQPRIEVRIRKLGDQDAMFGENFDTLQ